MTITILDLVLKGNMRKSMKQKKVMVIISYDYDDGCTVSNERVAEKTSAGTLCRAKHI